MRKENIVYDKQVICKGCNQPLIAKVLLNVYSKGVILHPHFELVCINCSYGCVIDNLKTVGKNEQT